MSKNKKLKKILWFSISIAFMIGIWWVLAVTYFYRAHFTIVPTPPQAFLAIFRLSITRTLWLNLWNTLWKVIVSFFASFILGLIFAILAKLREEVRLFITPIVTVTRAVPTIGVILILGFVFRVPEFTAIFIGFIMAFPVLYEGFYTAISEVDIKLLQMAKVHKVSTFNQLKGIYAPSLMPFLFGGAVQAMGMTLKVVIAAEIVGITVANTLGTAMFNANQTIHEIYMLFTWVIVAVLLSFALEGIIKLIGKFAMPWKSEK